MYLKSLELQGFKSFVEKTVLTLDRGLSAVVGPNGSGKSNVADAVRWVLGEQSTKTLRSNRMEDVIFKGTAERGPVGYAEVSLLLDNSDGTLPIEASEVMVTRRYFRSGESEYYINRATARLRDVHELFMDTGLGRDGYSIIGQGRIDEILSVRSGDRREIFEEAAGISKYRYRKEEAERKLEHTEQNLTRITDKIAELEITVEPLREQAEKAKKFLVLRDELRVMEVSLWTASLERLRASAAKVREDFETATKQFERETAEQEALYARAEQYANGMRQKDIELDEMRAALSDAEKRQSAAAGEAEVAENRIKSLYENIERLEKESNEQSNRERTLSEQIEERARRAEAGRENLKKIDADVVALESEINLLLSEAGEMEKREDALAAKLTFEESRAATLRIERSSLAASSGEKNARAERLIMDLQTRREEEHSVNIEFGKVSAELIESRELVESLQNVISGYELRLEKRRTKLTQTAEAVTKQRMEQAAAENRVKLLNDIAREYEGFSRAVKLVMRESDAGNLHGIHGPLSSLIKTSDEHSLAVETALGQSLQSIVTDNENHAKNAINYLKNRDGGRATFLPITAIRARPLDENVTHERGFVAYMDELVECDARYSDIVSNLLGRTVAAASMDDAIAIARKYSNRFRIVTLDGQIINAGGSMTGGSAGRETGVLSRRNEIERLNTSLEKINAALKQTEHEQRELQREVTAAGYELEVAHTELRAAEQRVIRAESEEASAGDKLRTVLSAIEAIEIEQKLITEQIENSSAASTRIDEQLVECEALADELRGELERVREGRGEMTDKRGGLTERMSTLRESRSATQAEVTGIEDGMRELQNMGEQYGSDRERRDALMGGFHAEIDELMMDAQAAKIVASDVGAECDGLKNAITQLNNARLADEAARTAAERELQDKSKTILNLEGERGRLEQRKVEVDIEERQIIDKMWESYELTPFTASTVAVSIDNMQNAQRDVTQKRRAISALGDVNVGAIDDFTRINERYTYLSTQAGDVRRSKSELESIISEITDKMRVIFAEKFTEINESFQTTFAELFGGGRACLRLEDEEDILNCGIIIEVRLPGKAQMSIGALSGGERAFVAIALYFSILKVRPTPFCVLDEVDTALDDLNVVRFAQYMKTLCARTQFISITHKRGTMEESDVLYGVTMQKAGVSRIIALDINEVERSLGMKLK